MNPTYKYIALYTLTQTGNQIVRIVSLGKSNNSLPAVITCNTYGFKVFYSERDNVYDIAENFFESDEATSVPNTYLGVEYTYNDYVASHRNYHKEGIEPDDYFVIDAKTYDGKKPITVLTNKYANSRVLTKKDLPKSLKVLKIERLLNNQVYDMASCTNKYQTK